MDDTAKFAANVLARNLGHNVATKIASAYRTAAAASLLTIPPSAGSSLSEQQYRDLANACEGYHEEQMQSIMQFVFSCAESVANGVRAYIARAEASNG